jgi:hypothetical protein
MPTVSAALGAGSAALRPRTTARGTFRAALGARTPRHVLRIRVKVNSNGRFSSLV